MVFQGHVSMGGQHARGRNGMPAARAERKGRGEGQRERAKSKARGKAERQRGGRGQRKGRRKGRKGVPAEPHPAAVGLH